MPAAAAEPCIRKARIRRCGISCLYVPFPSLSHLLSSLPHLSVNLWEQGPQISGLAALERSEQRGEEGEEKEKDGKKKS
jgi:hypothetical protein